MRKTFSPNLGLIVLFGLGLVLPVAGSGCLKGTTNNDFMSTNEDADSTDDGDQDNTGGDNDSITEDNPDCLTDVVSAPDGANCTCQYPDGSCDASEMQCVCDLDCYQDGDCLINCTCLDENCTQAECITTDPALQDCDSMQCTLPNDIEDDFVCVATDCEIEPDTVQLMPDETPAVAEQDLNREVKEAGILTLIDPSGSMTDNQRNLACAVDAFLDVVETAGAEFSMGVSVMNPQKLYDGSGDMVASAVPDLVGVSGCPTVPNCESTSYCNDDSSSQPSCQSYFTDNGLPVTSEDANAADTLRQLFVQDENREEHEFGDGVGDDESGLEYAFRYVMYLVSQGRGAEISQVVAVSDEAADGDGACCTIQERRYEPQNMTVMKEALGDDFNPPANTGNCEQDLINFYVYFFKRYNVQVNVLINLGDPDPVYIETANATHGAVGDIMDCASYEQFWQDVGTSTITISTQMCLDEAIDPGTLTLIYTENGVDQTVPRSDTDGWSYDAALGCIILNGSWADKYGSFRAAYESPNGSTPSGQVCFPDGVEPVLSTLVVKTTDGQVVPQSSTDGWTFDESTDCFTFHGSWADYPGPYDVDYNGNTPP